MFSGGMHHPLATLSEKVDDIQRSLLHRLESYMFLSVKDNPRQPEHTGSNHSLRSVCTVMHDYEFHAEQCAAIASHCPRHAAAPLPAVARHRTAPEPAAAAAMFPLLLLLCQARALTRGWGTASREPWLPAVACQ